MPELPIDPQAIDELMQKPTLLNDALRSIAEKEGRMRLENLFQKTLITGSQKSRTPSIPKRPQGEGGQFQKGKRLGRKKRK